MVTIQKKVCMLGNFGVGKTSLVRRFVYNLYEDKYLGTIGAKISHKVLTLPRDDSTVEMRVLLWDLAGHEAFSQVQANYLRGMAGAILVCDLTQTNTAKALPTFAEKVYDVNPRAKLIIAGNKCDLIGQQPNAVQQQSQKIEQLAATLEIPFYLTSAKTGADVERLFYHLGQLMLAG